MSGGADRAALLRILRSSRAVEERREAPFSLDVGQALETLARLFPGWTSPEDLSLDAHALNALSRVLQVQEGRLRYEAALFLADPEGLVEKLGKLSKDNLAELFLPAWKPAVEVEQVTTEGLALAYRYWLSIPPWEGRWPRGPRATPAAGEPLSEGELAALGILGREGFLRYLGDLWEELKGKGSISYWTFIQKGGFEETVGRAYGVSFLVTYGYADLDESGEGLKLEPRPERQVRSGGRSLAMVLGGPP